MEQWESNLIYELSQVTDNCISLKRFLENNSASVVNKGDNMYGVMESQLSAMLSYKHYLAQRVEMIWKR